MTKCQYQKTAFHDFTNQRQIGIKPTLSGILRSTFNLLNITPLFFVFPRKNCDYTLAIKLDPDYTDAYYYRGLLADKLGQRDAACTDFLKAQALGMEDIDPKIDRCRGTTKSDFPIHSILRLEKTAKNKTYGFTEKNPVMVGTGTEGGPANQRAYLDLLRDEQGQPVTYERLGSCCPYKSEHGYIGGMGMLDQYEITYLNERGVEKKAVVYISFYDYEEPLVLHGFKTVKVPAVKK